ncbi:hypothetical protein M231_01040 [Tremella mesenterica]|uniref:Uncharacterized protein n=1 Tax=Tremella mesenterica TaxID=5217 RepID=A0A4Q1BTX3_TREME|nr:uncharacterized protein TREMEDRAFT_65186 [Tremella mesenterica DSM 1558]EIW66784.1 hypothetical protein TREMEDRAFT_65186 [Tremella mesenterica DSM 1558]RXK41541.1 hypothetical protein M231_01040 [Tremella mesenterica]
MSQYTQTLTGPATTTSALQINGTIAPSTDAQTLPDTLTATALNGLEAFHHNIAPEPLDDMKARLTSEIYQDVYRFRDGAPPPETDGGQAGSYPVSLDTPVQDLYESYRTQVGVSRTISQQILTKWRQSQRQPTREISEKAWEAARTAPVVTLLVPTGTTPWSRVSVNAIQMGAFYFAENGTVRPVNDYLLTQDSVWEIDETVFGMGPPDNA